MKRSLRFEIPPDRDGAPIADFLAQRFPYHSRDGWLSRIADRRIHIDGRIALPDHVLRTGEILEYAASDIPEPPVSMDVRVVFDDPDLLVLDKPPNLPCHPGGRYFNHTLWAWLKHQGGIAEPILVNRLDRETSGLIVVARNPDAGKRCRSRFASREVEKRYLVLVEGAFPPALRAEGRLVEDPSAPIRKKRRFVPADLAPSPIPPAANKELAVTTFRLLETVSGVSLLEARPETGRLHQIRATLCSLGFPVVGDKLYGVDPALFLRFCNGQLTDQDRHSLRMDRQALHASALSFRHPRTGKPLHFELPLPADMSAVLHGSRRAAASTPEGQ